VETREPEIDAEHPVPDLPEVIIPPVAPIPAVVTQLLMFGMSHEAGQRRKALPRSARVTPLSDQLGLFQD